MAGISKEQIKKIHAYAARLGMIHGEDRDKLHSFIYAQTGREHVSDLTEAEADTVIKTLTPMLLQQSRVQIPASGMMSEEQRRKAWAVMYQICEVDPREGVSAGVRMLGVIRKLLGRDVALKAPFAWISEEDGVKLIEQLKRYLASAKRQAAKRSG